MNHQRIKFGKFLFWKELPGVISSDYIWCCKYDGYLHSHVSFCGLLKQIMLEYRHDRHMVG